MSAELLRDAVEKARHLLVVNDGKIYRAYDDLECGLIARELIGHYNGQMEQAFGSLTGRAIGNALMFSMISIEAERKHRFERERPEEAGEWTLDEAWQARINRDTASTMAVMPKAYVKYPLQALVGREPCNGDADDLRWHISIAHEDRIPTWEEFAGALHELRPGVAFALGVPPRSWWMNLDDRVLHGWETKDANLIAQWRHEHAARGRADTPT